MPHRSGCSWVASESSAPACAHAGNSGQRTVQAQAVLTALAWQDCGQNIAKDTMCSRNTVLNLRLLQVL